MNIIQKPAAPENWKAGRPCPVVGIVIHVEAGTEAGTDAWFDDPEAHVSAHYGISRAGEIHQYVQEQDQAFHAGTVDRPTSALVAAMAPHGPNAWSIGIEHEGQATDEWTDEQYAASVGLVADICKRHAITIDRDHIIGHHEIRFGKSCPGMGDVDRIVAMANGVA